MTSNYDVEIENEPKSDSTETTWHWWQKMRSLLEENSKISVSLVLTPDLPNTEEEINRWFSEPIKSLTIPTSLFLSNKSGFPVLSKAHQQFVNKFFQVI